jgi:hypothetical protein
MITINIEENGQDFEVSEGSGDIAKDVLVRHLYDLRIMNDALMVRVKELQNLYGCENCRGNPLTMPMSKEVAAAAFRAVFNVIPDWVKKNKDAKDDQR